MAEFCLDCWNKINKTNDTANKYIVSDDLDLCEGCGEWKHTIIIERKYYYLQKLWFIVMPLKAIYFIFFTLWRILILPYYIYQYKKHKK